MQRRESKNSLTFRHWLRAHPQHSCAYEVKQTQHESILFSALKEHQANYLEAITSDKGALIRVIAQSGEPDYVYLRNATASVVIFFPHFFCIISIKEFLKEKKRSNRASLTSERAYEIADLVIDTKKPR